MRHVVASSGIIRPEHMLGTNVKTLFLNILNILNIVQQLKSNNFYSFRVMTAAFMCGQKVLTGIFQKYQHEFKYDVSISLE